MVALRSLIKQAGLLAAMSVASVSSHAFSITLDTTLLQANSTLTLTQTAMQAMSAIGVSLSAGGYATNLGNNSAGLAQYNIPVTSLTANISLFPLSLAPTQAKTAGSTLSLTSAASPGLGGGGSATISNMLINFSNDTIFGSVTSDSGTVNNVGLFTFNVTKPLTFSLNGGISLTESLGNLTLTQNAATMLTSDLKYPSFLAGTFQALNFGSIDAKIVPWFRSTPLGSVNPVPEPSTYAILAVGLGLAGVAARRRKAS